MVDFPSEELLKTDPTLFWIITALVYLEMGQSDAASQILTWLIELRENGQEPPKRDVRAELRECWREHQEETG